MVFSDKPEVKNKAWYLPGGMTCGLENVAESCVREVFEETGLLEQKLLEPYLITELSIIFPHFCLSPAN